MTWRKSALPIVREERGIALVISILTMALLYVLGVIFLSVSTTESTIARNGISTARVLYVADAGIELARRQVDSSSNWRSAFNDLNLPGLVKEYSTAINTADGNVSDWSTTAPSPLSNAKRIRWSGLTITGGTYTVMGASVDENGTDLSSAQARVLAIGYVPNSSAPKAVKTIEALLPDYADFLDYGFGSTGEIFSDAITFASQPGGRNDSYNGGPGTFQPTLDTGYYSGGNIPSGGGWSSLESLDTSLTFPTIDFAKYASSPTVVNLNALRDANGVVSLTNPADITPNTVYYVDGSFFIGNIGNNPKVSFIATHDIKNNATNGMHAVNGYPLFLTGGYIYMDTDNTLPLRGAIYSDGSHALAADRTYLINPTWVGHGGTDLVYVESASQIIGAVAARIPPGSGLRLFGGGNATITYNMNLLDGLANLYVNESAPGGSKYLSWREK